MGGGGGGGGSHTRERNTTRRRERHSERNRWAQWVSVQGKGEIKGNRADAAYPHFLFLSLSEREQKRETKGRVRIGVYGFMRRILSEGREWVIFEFWRRDCSVFLLSPQIRTKLDWIYVHKP